MTTPDRLAAAVAQGHEDAVQAWPRVVRTPGALYGAVISRKRRRCDGHMAPERHWIEPGRQYVASALPPDSEIGNKGWWHSSFCMDCCPAEYAMEVPR